jgi:phage baseplate assembly protein W
VTFIAFPFHLGDHGRTATATSEDHIRQMIEQVLFTRPGERVNRPDFGCGLLDVVFAPNSPQAAAAAQLTISSSLQRWLGDLISVQSVQVSAELSTLQVQISYTVTASGTAQSATLALGAAP